ncbi:amino acid--tRNA ligase-related protein [Escherichia coli]
MEVETPMMQVIPGGAAARPFITHHNALEYRHVPGRRRNCTSSIWWSVGFERVFEINRNFRNKRYLRTS